ncbi:MAG: PKD domain-containing protein [Fibrobacterota bacterium]|nr:PKD domain-containing protein [Fibrobacterota bacterium]
MAEIRSLRHTVRILRLILACLLAAIATAPIPAQPPTEPARPRIEGFTHSPGSPLQAGTVVRFMVTATHSEGARLEYSWEFDDGTPRTAWDGSSSIEHVYAQPGIYAVRVRVQDPLEFEVVDIIRIRVVTGSDVVPPHSSPLALDSARRHLWVANPDHNSVSIIHADALNLVKEIPVGGQPLSVALDRMGNAWVACRKTHEVKIVSADGLSILKSLKFGYGSSPTAILFSTDGTAAYVSLEGPGAIQRLDAKGMTLSGRLSVGPFPRALAATPDGKRLLATRFLSSDSAGMVWSIDLQTFDRAETIALPLDRTSFESGTAARGLPNYVATLAVHPSGTSAWYAAKKDNILQGLNRDGRPLTFESTMRSVISTLNLGSGTGTGSETTAFRIDLDNTSQPSAVAFSSHGTFLFVTMQGSNRLFILDPQTRHVLVERETGLAPQGVAVDAISGRVYVQDFLGRTVTVFDAKALLATGDTTVTRLAAVPVSSREPLPEKVLAGKRLFYNAKDPRMSLDGYTSCAACHLDGGHDGRTWDFTDRGEGLRNTTTLLGKAGMGHGPLHWSANFDELQDFEHDMRGPFGGKGFMNDVFFQSGLHNTPLGDPKAGKSPDLDALAAYVASLTGAPPSPYRNPDGAFGTDALAGGLIFNREDVGCAKCHIPPHYTDSRLPGHVKPAAGAVAIFPEANSQYTEEGFLLHDVGTLKPTSGQRLAKELPGMDTPTLKGIWQTAPYLHDGSAATVMDVLTTANNGDKHGKTSHLSAVERENLVAFLLQLDEADKDGNTGLVRKKAASDPRRLSLLRSFEGRPQGLILNGFSAGELPSLSLHTLEGKKIQDFRSQDWQPLRISKQSELYLPWPFRTGGEKGLHPGLYLVRAATVKGIFSLKIMVTP